jgi:hypothetical protein
MYKLSGVGAIILISVYFIHDETLFVLFIAFGSTFVFMTYSGINLTLMLSVPKKSRSFAIALNCALLHIFGDVPSPIFTGFLKDILAPNCASTEEDDGDIATSTNCRKQKSGLRLCMLIVFMWLLWTFFFYFLAHLFSKYYLDGKKSIIKSFEVSSNADDEVEIDLNSENNSMKMKSNESNSSSFLQRFSDYNLLKVFSVDLQSKSSRYYYYYYYYYYLLFKMIYIIMYYIEKKP